MGPATQAFERACAREAGVGHAVAVSNGTAALFLSLASPEEQPSESVSVAGQSASLFDISPAGSDGARSRMMVVLLARPDITWFIKMTGPATLLDQQAGAFREFLKTIRLEGAAG